MGTGEGGICSGGLRISNCGSFARLRVTRASGNGTAGAANGCRERLQVAFDRAIAGGQLCPHVVEEFSIEILT
jgi:hypothetical protein